VNGWRDVRLQSLIALIFLTACGANENDLNRLAADSRDPGYSESLETRIEDIQLETRAMEGTTWRIEAPQGVLSRDARRIDLQGGVAVEGGASAALEPLRLETKTLQYDLDTERVRTRDDVRLTMQGYTLSATGLDANLRTRQVQLRTEVQGRFAR
jgi:lipopolysaccharide export system protein LptC